MKLLLLILSFSARFCVASALSPDGLTLLSLLKHWTFVPPPIDSSWKATDSTPCSWVGVLCDHDSNAISLNLTASGINGQLGPEIEHLNHLQTVVLLANGFSGIIPPELGNCSLLQYIDLSENHFTGQIPYTLKKLQNLQYISFSSNLLTGEIPESLFQIPHLEEVYLYNNSLSGPIPSNIGNTTQLSKLYLSRNQLSGTIPPSIGNCSKLEALFLNENRLKGSLPQSLNNLKNLAYLDVRNNSLGGTIPLGSGGCGRLFILDLSFNVFSGGIPSGLGNCSGLAEFAAVNSNLVGSIPSSLGLLRELSILRLPENHLSGKIPPEIGNCKSLRKLHLYSNQLEGEIPKELGKLSKLQYLELYFNHLTGEIPLSIWKIQSLKHLLVHNNSLSGQLAPELTELKHLKNISLFDNQLSGVIPQSLGINSSLVKLDLMNNKFTGNIPPDLCFGKQLRILSIGLNQLQGGIPHDVGRCATLRRLTLNENNLTGSLPEFESNTNLIYMDISKNKISGAIPSSLGNCTSLTGLILSMNIITGLIPSELGNLVNLQALNLAHNNLQGPLPQQLSYCAKMETFDVGFNFLNGSFPSSLRSWTGLTKLILTENRFSGVIPSFLSEFKQLLELQLGGNLFVGKIPTSVGALQNLLYGLNLSANGLTGEIPLEVRQLIKLQSLDLSLNNLTGSIDSLDGLSSLTEVNISYNSFVGPVPERLMQYLTSSPSSFLGIPGLCIPCSPSDGLSRTKTSYLKPCDCESTDHKGISDNKGISDHKGISKFVILIIELGFPLVVTSLLVTLMIMRLSGQRSKEEAIAYNEKRELWSFSGEGEHRIIDLKYKRKVMEATENLDDRYIIGRGGDGIVYKAELDFGVFAVKKLVVARSKRKRLSMVREIEVIKKIRHQNVARFLGSWIGKDYGLIFCWYMENGSLHDVLHGNNPPQSLEWNVRYKIAVGVAKGLTYLHHDCNPPILHRDIKPKNILLDSNMEPYITDFGIAMALNQSATLHMRSTYHLGTHGYMAPETAYTIVPNCKSDVYSYGVLLLELITRNKVLDSSFEEQGTTLVGWFKSVWREAREIKEIVDSGLARELSDLNVQVQIIKVLLVALICTEKDPGKRLEMRDIIKIYEAPTVQGIFVQHDTTSFHLGSSLATAVDSIFLQVRTIVIKGLPKDVKQCQRELPNRLGLLPGYESFQLSFIDGRLIGYALFNTALQAAAAKDTLQDSVIDAGTKSVLRIEMANKNYFFQRGTHYQGKQVWTDGDYPHPHTGYASASPSSSSYPPPPVRGTYGYMSPPSTQYYPHGSLHDVLHEKNPLPTLEWNVRYKIAISIAEKLAFLYHDCDPPVVHQAINPKNIRIDSEMEPHISDCGVSMLLNQSASASEFSTYIAPENEYTMVEGVVSDIHDYGVVLLELITRKKVLDPSFLGRTTLVGWVRSVWRETGNLEKIVDPSLARELRDSRVVVQLTKVLCVALLCCENDSRNRPTMRNVIKLL